MIGPARIALTHPRIGMTSLALACRCLGHLSLLLLPWGGWAPSHAQTVATRIAADPGAPSGERPTVLTTANGIVQVDIRTPTAGGVSRNTYRQFDVGTSGAILNNSQTSVQTQLGGWIQANPWLARGAARIILNEVNSSDPSLLHGFVEVAGQRAQVVVANPAGIVVNGGGFINATQAVLTTGVAVMIDGNLERFRVQGGTVRIEGQGLDARDADYTAILGRVVQVNAGLWARHLQVVTGANDIRATTVAPGATLQASPVAGAGETPNVALDVAALGGMYAGKIFLVGTEAGVGVRNAGQVLATAGALTLTHDGWLSNKGTLQANADLSIRARGHITQDGTVYGGGHVRLESQSGQAHSGTVAAQGDVQILATDRGTRIDGGATASWSAGMQADGSLSGRGRLDVQAGQAIQSAGKLLATDALHLAADAVDLSKSAVQAPVVEVNARQGDLVASGSQILAGQSLQLRAAEALTTDGARLQSAQVQLQADRIVNTDGQILSSGDMAFHAGDIDNGARGEIVAAGITQITLTGRLTNRGLIDGDDTWLQASQVDNVGTGRIFGNRVAIAAGTLDNRDETIGGTTHAAVIAGRERVDLGVQTLINREQALIYSGGDMAVGGVLDVNHQASGSASLIDNQSAMIEASQGLRVDTAVVRNTNAHFATEIQRTGAGTAITEYQHQTGDVYRVSDISTRFPDAQVSVYPSEAMCLASPAGISDAFLRYDYTRTVDDTVITQSAPALLLAGADIRLVAETLLNDKSQILAGGDLDLKAKQLTQLDGEGTRTVNDTGTATSYWRVRHRGLDGYGSSSGPYAAPASVQSISLHAARKDGQVNPSSGNASPAPTAVAPLGDGLSRLPRTSLYRQHPESSAHYLVETDPRFASYRNWLSSDYLLRRSGLDPAAMQKRLGDGFYEQQLVREQVMQRTGQRYLADFRSDEAQYQALMDNAVTYAQRLNLRPGIALSPVQVAQLTSDIVWLETREVVLPDGSRQQVLVPQLYARAQPGDVDVNGALLAGRNVDIHVGGDMALSGTMAGRSLVRVNAQNIRQLGGSVSGDQAEVQATQDLDVTGAQILGIRSLRVNAGRDLNLSTTTRSSGKEVGGNSFSQTGVDRVASLYVTGTAGPLIASAGRDITLFAGQVRNAGSGDVDITAGRDVRLSTANTDRSLSIQWNSVHYLQQGGSQEVGAQVGAGGSVHIGAGRDVEARAASVQGKEDLAVHAGRDIRVSTGQATQELETANRVKGGNGYFSRQTISTHDTRHDTRAQASEIGGRTATLTAGQDVAIQGSQVVADTVLRINAVRDVTVQAAQETHASTSSREESKRGVFSGGGIGVTIGSQKHSLDQSQAQATAAASTVGSVDGHVEITAGRRYMQAGSDVLAPAGDVAIRAQAVTIQEARETAQQRSEEKFRQSGLTVAITAPVVTSLQAMGEVAQAVGDTKSGRMQALGAATLALQAQDLARQAASIGQALDEGKRPDEAAGVGISISVGGRSSRSGQQARADTAKASTVRAGGDVTILAQGAGLASDLVIQGSEVQAAGTTTLRADHAVTLSAARNHTSQASEESSSSASVGLSARAGEKGMEFGVTASASRGVGRGDGEATSYTNTHVDGDQVVIRSGEDTTLRGAVFRAGQVTVDAGGQLVIESLQDRDRYNESSRSLGGSITIGAGAGGSLSASRSRIDSDFTSVAEQSGIRAGDEGFAVSVGGDTRLVGGAITSTQAAVDVSRNSFSTGGSLVISDLHNTARYEARSTGVTLGSGGVNGLTGAGVGRDGGSAASTTTAGISGLAGDAAERTGDQEQGIARIFDKDRVKEEVAAQMRITQAFGQQASRTVGDYADRQLVDLRQQASQAAAEADTDRSAALAAEAGKWEEGGVHRVGLHALVGGLSGGLQGAAGAATSQAIVPQVGDILRNTDLPLEVKQGLVLATGAAIGAALGGVEGGSAAFNATANNYLSAVDLRSREQRLKEARAKGDVSEELRILKEFERNSAQNTAAISYGSVLSEQALTLEKQQLENLLKDANLPAETKAQAQRSIKELSTAINVLQRSPALRDAAQLGLVLSDVILLGEATATKVLTSGLIKKIVAQRTGAFLSDEAATAITNNFYRDGASVDYLRSAFQTNSNEAVFWSGKTNGVGGIEVAKQAADRFSGRTLEQIVESRLIPMPAYDPSIPSSVRAWTEASKEFAQNASGEIRVVLGAKLRPQSIWEAVEYPTLLQNPNVTKIIVLDPRTGAERTLFQRISN